MRGEPAKHFVEAAEVETSPQKQKVKEEKDEGAQAASSAETSLPGRLRGTRRTMSRDQEESQKCARRIAGETTCFVKNSCKRRLEAALLARHSSE